MPVGMIDRANARIDLQLAAAHISGQAAALDHVQQGVQGGGMELGDFAGAMGAAGQHGARAVELLDKTVQGGVFTDHPAGIQDTLVAALDQATRGQAELVGSAGLAKVAGGTGAAEDFYRAVEHVEGHVTSTAMLTDSAIQRIEWDDNAPAPEVKADVEERVGQIMATLPKEPDAAPAEGEGAAPAPEGAPPTPQEQAAAAAAAQAQQQATDAAKADAKPDAGGDGK